MPSSNTREEIPVSGIPKPISHYTPVVRAGRMVFISGMEPKDENGATVGKGDVTAQARQVHENLKKCLAAAERESWFNWPKKSRFSRVVSRG